MKTLPAALLLLFAASAARGLDLPREKDRWIRTIAGNQEIYSNAPARDMVRVARDLQAFRHTIAAVTRLNTDDPLPTKIFIFKDAASFAPFRNALLGRRVDRVAGLYLAHTNGNFISVRADGDDTAIVYHELVHAFVKNSISSVPSWLNEGLAEYYSTFRRSGEEAAIGEPVDHHVRLLRSSGIVPMGEFFTSTRTTRESRDGVREGRFYAQSWLFTHYVLGETDKTEQLVEFLQAVDRGSPIDPAFQTAFGITLDELRVELHKYVRRQTFPARRIRLEELKLPPIPAPTAVSYADLLASLGELLASSGAAVEAESFLETAILVDPAHPVAHAGLALLRQLAGDDAAASRHLRTAVRSPAATAMHHLVLAEHLMHAWPEGATVVPPDADEVRRALRAATDSNPRLARAWTLLGRSFLAGGDAAEGVAALEKSWSLQGPQPDVAHGLVALNAKLERRSAAEGWMQTLLKIGTAEQIASARDAIAAISFAEADRLARGGRLEEAIALLEAASGTLSSATLKREIDSRLGDLRRVGKHNAVTARYNEAVSLVNTGRNAEAIRILDEILAGDASGELIAAARKLRDRLSKR